MSIPTSSLIATRCSCGMRSRASVTCSKACVSVTRRTSSRYEDAVIGLGLVARLWRRRAIDYRMPIDALLGVGFVAIDLETTGLDARRDVVVAIAAVPFEDGRPRDGLVTLVNPGRSIPPASTAIHGIDDAAVVGAPFLHEVLPRFEAVCTHRIVVGH